MANTILSEGEMLAILNHGFQKKIQEFFDKELSRISKEFEEKLRAEIPNIAASMINNYDIINNGNYLTISIRILKKGE